MSQPKLIECSACGKSVSVAATSCPACGHPVAEETKVAETVPCEAEAPEVAPPEKAEPQPKLIECPACDKRISAAATSCPACGHPVAEEKKEAETVPSETEVTRSEKTETKPEEKKKSGFIVKGIKILGAIFILLFIIGLFVKKDDKPTSVSSSKAEVSADVSAFQKLSTRSLVADFNKRIVPIVKIRPIVESTMHASGEWVCYASERDEYYIYFIGAKKPDDIPRQISIAVPIRGNGNIGEICSGFLVWALSGDKSLRNSSERTSEKMFSEIGTALGLIKKNGTFPMSDGKMRSWKNENTQFTLQADPSSESIMIVAILKP